MRIHIYQRYLIREIFLTILLVLVAFVALYSFFELLEEIKKNVGRGSYHLPQAFLVVLLKTPGHVYELMPVAVLIGSLYALSTLAQRSELTVLRISGLSTTLLLLVLLKLTVALAFVTLLIGELIAPAGEQIAQELFLSSTKKLIGKRFLTGVWVKDGRNIVNVRTVRIGDKLKGIRIYNLSDQQELTGLIEAKSGEYHGEGSWELRDVTRTDLKHSEAKITQLETLRWDSAVTPEVLRVLDMKPERMSAYQLNSYVQYLSKNKQRTARYEVALWKKITYPFSILVMITLALLFGQGYGRTSNIRLQIFLGVLVGVSFYLLNGLFSNLGVIQTWHPFVSALIPSLLFFIVAISMLWRNDRR